MTERFSANKEGENPEHILLILLTVIMGLNTT